MADQPSVTYTGMEVVIVAGILAGALPSLDDNDFEVADLLLERALAAIPGDRSPDIKAAIERQRARRGRP